ncbi:hypothetical protein [Croceibacterium ferulae]|uniref:hypothetical protein n=1 Tax=Croceibacterium ferulae TaxID=1854641 RepID=UPI000EB2254A|nr:hypothetical protein [Croceibacterium ferulae]
MSLCRICSANDEEALVEDVARSMWDTQRSSDPDDAWRPWDQAGPYWQRVMLQFAKATVKMLRTEHYVQ